LTLQGLSKQLIATDKQFYEEVDIFGLPKKFVMNVTILQMMIPSIQPENKEDNEDRAKY
jgi:hypothetical protein